MTEQQYSREGVWLGEAVSLGDDGWDHAIPDCQERVPPKVLEYIARRCANGEPVTFPSGFAGHILHGAVYVAIQEADCEGGGQRRQVAASILMGLAATGWFRP
jgi:hypothetical protein